MDEETRAILADILAGPAPSRKPRKPTPREALSDAWRTDMFEATRVREVPKVFRLGIHLIPVVENTLASTAILSVNTSKACIVLKAEYTTSTLEAILRITGDITKRLRWNANDQVLEIDPTYLPQLKFLLKQNYASVQVLGVQKQAKATKFDLLLSKLDSADKKSIYSMLARKYHPDMSTGDKEIMTLVNLVFKGGD